MFLQAPENRFSNVSAADCLSARESIAPSYDYRIAYVPCEWTNHKANSLNNETAIGDCKSEYQQSALICCGPHHQIYPIVC